MPIPRPHTRSTSPAPAKQRFGARPHAELEPVAVAAGGACTWSLTPRSLVLEGRPPGDVDSRERDIELVLTRDLPGRAQSPEKLGHVSQARMETLVSLVTACERFEERADRSAGGDLATQLEPKVHARARGTVDETDASPCMRVVDSSRGRRAAVAGEQCVHHFA